MGLNWRELDALLAELPLEGAFIQGMNQPRYDQILLELYQPGEPFRLLIGMSRKTTRLCRTAKKCPKQKKRPRFIEFLNSRVKGSRILSCSQWQKERILEMKIRRQGEEMTLWIRLWGGAPNIIVTNAEGIILEACYRRPNRGETAGESYHPSQDIKAASVSKSPPKPQTASQAAPPSAPKEFPLGEYPGEGDYNSRVDRYFLAQEEAEEQEKLRQRALTRIRQRITGLTKRKKGLEVRLADYADPAHLKEQGDLIMGNLHKISRGDKEVVTENWYRPGETIRIPLDPRVSASENGEAYYRKYQKALRGRERLKEERAALDQALAEMERRLELVPELEDVRAIEDLIPPGKKQKQQGPSGSDEQPGLRFYSGSFLLLVGRNAKENDALLRRWVRGNDMWMHTRHYPGGYVFIRTIRGKSIPLETLLDAGNLALHFSKARGAAQAEMYYTQVKYLRRTKDGPKGLVIPTQEKNLDITRDDQRLEALLGKPDTK